MDKFLKRKSTLEQSSTSQISLNTSAKKRYLELDLENLPEDPGLRPKMSDYHPNNRDEIIRAYIGKGPCQPREHKFPKTKFGNIFRRFNPNWFNEFGNWLEYSISKDAAYCLCCYLMRSEVGEQKCMNCAFVTQGFTNWKKKEKLQTHVGDVNSAHNQAWKKYQELINRMKHIEQKKGEYRAHLTIPVDCIRLILRQGWFFYDHVESEHSSNQDIFLQLLHFLADHNKEVDEVFKKCHDYLKLTAPRIQKDIVRAAGSQTTKAIIDDIGDACFAVLIYESWDIEKIAVVFRYVDRKGHAIERFSGSVRASDTKSSSLKSALDSLFAKYELSLSRVRGQGYEASNMQDEFNGLKNLMSKENSCAFYVHCFAHQLQLSLVAVAKKNIEIALFFNLVTKLSNVVGASCKQKEILNENQFRKVREVLKGEEISYDRGLSQDIIFRTMGDARWDSQYGMLLNLIDFFSSVIDVLEFIEEDAISLELGAEACGLLDSMQSFEFVFNLHLMKSILGITVELSQVLQRGDQEIVNAMRLVNFSKQNLQTMRDDGWHHLLNEASSFCDKYNIAIPNMDDIFVAQGRSRCKVEKASNLHHLIGMFHQVIDQQLQELNNRFTEMNVELLLCVACISPRESFSAFDKEKLIRLAQFYPSEFSQVELVTLDYQLQNYIADVRSDKYFSKLNGIDDLSKMMVERRKHIIYPLVYLLIKLSLILPITSAMAEKTSAMKFVTNQKQNIMEDEFLNDCLVTFIERDVFDSIENEEIIQSYQNMNTGREQGLELLDPHAA